MFHGWKRLTSMGRWNTATRNWPPGRTLHMPGVGQNLHPDLTGVHKLDFHPHVHVIDL